jgi:FkbM family methyltransferase
MYSVDTMSVKLNNKVSSFFLGLIKVLFSPRQYKKSYSQFGEDCVLYQIFGGRKNKRGFYVDVGCHHPRKGSNTYFLYKLGWRGILIDLELSKIYACKILRPNDTSVLAAVSNTEEKVKIFSPRPFSVLTTISKDAANGEIVTKTLTSIINSTKYINKEIDLLSIDVEGVDLKVLEGLNFKIYNPKVIVVESWVKNIADIYSGEIHKFLSKKGYEITSWVGLSLIYQLKKINSQP